MSTVVEIATIEIDQDELFAVTEDVLDRLNNRDVVNRVSVVRGYAELYELYPDAANYGQRLIEAIFSLAQSVDAHGDSVLASCLYQLVEGFKPSGEQS